MRATTFFLVLFMATSVLAEEWKLGTTQIQGFAGINVAEARDTGIEPSLGFGLAVGLNPYLAFTGGYSYNRFASVNQVICLPTCVLVSASAVMHEALAGLRMNVANPSRATPYFLFLAGFAKMQATGRALGVSVAVSEMKAAVGSGGGVDVGLAKNLALLFDVRLIRPRDFGWYARASVGLAVRFN